MRAHSGAALHQPGALSGNGRTSVAPKRLPLVLQLNEMYLRNSTLAR